MDQGISRHDRGRAPRLAIFARRGRAILVEQATRQQKTLLQLTKDESNFRAPHDDLDDFLNDF